MSSRTAVASLAFAALLTLASSPGEKIRNHFDSDTPGRPPGYFDLTVLGNPGPAEWRIVADFNPPSAPNKLIQTRVDRPDGSVAVAMRRNYSFADGRVSIGVKKGSGRGGLVFRAANDRDFLALLVDVASGEAVLTSHRAGKATELARAKADLDREWGILSVTAKGPEVRALWNGKALLSATDPSPVAGGLGPATAGAGSVSFDELSFEPLK